MAPLLTLNVYEALQAAARAGRPTVECSLDLDRSTTTVELTDGGWVWQPLLCSLHLHLLQRVAGPAVHRRTGGGARWRCSATCSCASTGATPATRAGGDPAGSRGRLQRAARGAGHQPHDHEGSLPSWLSRPARPGRSIISPDNVWYGGVTVADCEQIIVDRLEASRPVAMLRLAPELHRAGRFPRPERGAAGADSVGHGGRRSTAPSRTSWAPRQPSAEADHLGRGRRRRAGHRGAPDPRRRPPVAPSSTRRGPGHRVDGAPPRRSPASQPARRRRGRGRPVPVAGSWSTAGPGKGARTASEQLVQRHQYLHVADLSRR